MADVKISQLQRYTPIKDGVMIPCSVEVDGKWKSKAIATDDFVNYTYAGVLGHLAEGRGIDLAWDATNTKLVVTCDLDTSVAKVVTALPTSDIDDSKIYLVPITGAGEEGDTGDAENKYAEWLYTNKGTAESPNYVWEKIGERQIETDLSGYYTKTDVDDLISDMATRTWINTSAYLTQASAAATYATIASVTEITKENGTIDTKISAAISSANLSQYLTKTEAESTYATIISVTEITKENGTIDTKISAAISSANLSQYLTKTEAESTYATKDSISDMASKTWVGQQDYATKSEVSTATDDMATQTWVNGLGYITYDYAKSTYATITYAAARYVKPDGGIPKDDLASTVKTSLGLADTALQSAALDGYATETWVEGLNYLTQTKAAETYATKDDVSVKYTKPSTGIPATDLASTVQTSLGKADSAVQPADLATYATHDWVNDLGYITGAAAASSYATITSVNAITEPTTGTIDTRIAAATKLVNYSAYNGTNDALNPATDDTFQTAISKLHKAILDNEGVNATAVSTIKNSLGFGESLNYSPTAAALTGKNVTEAVDYLAGQVATQSGTLDGKQDTIDDLATIRSNASNGQAAYAALNPTGEGAVTYEELKAEVVALRAIVNAMIERLGYGVTDGNVTWSKEFLVVDDWSYDPESSEGE